MSTTNPVQHPRSPKSGPTALSPASASLLVAEREIAAQIRSKSFLISTAITSVAIDIIPLNQKVSTTIGKMLILGPQSTRVTIFQ